MASPPCTVLKMVEVCQIAPPSSQGDSTAPKSLPLTFLDILWLRFPPVQCLFSYEAETASFYDLVLPKLKHSLSLCLHYYLPLAGSLIWPTDSCKPLIYYVDGDGVSFTVAESLGGPLDFRGLTGPGFHDAGDFHPLIPRLDSSDERAKPVAIQVTLFPGSGICIGINSHHAVMDGKTATDFMKSWARICRSAGALPDECRPFYDRTAIGGPAGLELEAIYVDDYLNDNGPENRSLRVWDFVLPSGSVRGTFEMTRVSVEALRRSLKGPAVSTFSLICGYVSICYFKSLGIVGGGDPSAVVLGIIADLRTRLKPAVPPAYFGNCVYGRKFPMETGILLGGEGIVRAVEAIREAVKSLEGENVLQGAENLVSSLVSGREKAVSEVQEYQKRLSATAFFVGSPKFEVYSTDFGFGRPKKVEMISNDRTGAICLFDSKNGNGGVEIGLALKLHEMEAFEVEFVKGLEGL